MSLYGFENSMGDAAAMQAIGACIEGHRLLRNMTQADLASEAGISKRTLIRLEGGQSTQLTNLIRVLRVLGLLGQLGGFAPPQGPSPLEQLKLQGRQRQRASRASSASAPDAHEKEPQSPGGTGWTWGEDKAAKADNKTKSDSEVDKDDTREAQP